jgi:hypothetical protein
VVRLVHLAEEARAAEEPQRLAQRVLTLRRRRAG